MSDTSQLVTPPANENGEDNTPSSLTHDTHELLRQPRLQTPRSKGDPRDETFVLKYQKANFSEGQAASFSDLYQMVSVLLGMCAFMIRMKWACWASLFMFYTSLINAKSEGRLQQMFTGFSIILISFVNIYLAPPKPAGMSNVFPGNLGDIFQKPTESAELPSQ